MDHENSGNSSGLDPVSIHSDLRVATMKEAILMKAYLRQGL
jgi:hypothetical protein